MSRKKRNYDPKTIIVFGVHIQVVSDIPVNLSVVAREGGGLKLLLNSYERCVFLFMDNQIVAFQELSFGEVRVDGKLLTSKLDPTNVVNELAVLTITEEKSILIKN